MMSTIDKILHGSIDMHIHAGPDPRVERKVDALQTVLQAQEAGIRAIVLKSHEYPTAPLAYIVNKITNDKIAYGSITLNYEVGGLNPNAVIASANLGAKVVWMPTFSSAHDMQRKNILEGGISIIDGNNNLLPVVEEILDIIKEYDLVLATGHISSAEVFSLVEQANKKEIRKIVITHPLSPDVGASLNIEEQKRISETGAFIEHPYNLTSPLMDNLDIMKLVEAIQSIGAEHCIMSTDSGQIFNPAPAEVMRVMIANMLDCGITEREMEIMIKSNPAKLLDLQGDSQ